MDRRETRISTGVFGQFYFWSGFIFMEYKQENTEQNKDFDISISTRKLQNYIIIDFIHRRHAKLPSIIVYKSNFENLIFR